MSNPYESPKTASEPMEPPRITWKTVGTFVGGFLACGAMTFVAMLGMGMVAESLGTAIFGPYGGIFLLVISPGFVAPICSVILWAFMRKRNRPFAIGAVAAGVSAFLIVGGCFTVVRTFN